jgi:hypothetical protein
MRHHDMWVPTLGLGAGLSGVIGSVSRGTCTILQAKFGELTFHALRCIRVRRDQSSYALALDSSFSSALSRPLFRRLQYYLSSDRDYKHPPCEQAPQVYELESAQPPATSSSC